MATIKQLLKNKILMAVSIGLIAIFIVVQLSGRTLCNCSTSDDFDPTKPGVHHK